ncbi:MAG: UDP-N-acetylmuramate--L-alanine ligase [Gemmatimonadetes bacterium]|nr:UDP-N-acetylmuramate--L-alanine ligase [Gemmatimonadota bacterium]
MRFRAHERFHLMGIGGAGMSALAELLLAEGYEVSGCDAAPGEFAAGLEARGVRIARGHAAEHVAGTHTLVVSSAIPRDHREVEAARAADVPVVRRAELLAEVARGRLQVAIAGTHGKSTTTTLTGCALTAAGFDPTVVVGGAVRGSGGNVRWGRGEPFVVEADEFDRSFLTLAPVYALVTSVDADHMDTYGSMRALGAAFVQFLDRVPFHGRAFWCADHAGLRRLVRRSRAPLTSYGLSPRACVRGSRIRQRGLVTEFRLSRGGEGIGSITLGLPGRLNVQNAVGAAALALELGAGFEAIRTGLAECAGVTRRFEVKPCGSDVIVVDDYAHHPAEIRATLRAAREGWSRRLIALFQPHLFTRTRDLATELGAALTAADVVLVTDVYPSREAPLPGVTGELVAAAARGAGHADVTYVQNLSELATRTLERVRTGDLVVAMGAGDIGNVAGEIAAALAANAGDDGPDEARAQTGASIHHDGDAPAVALGSRRTEGVAC